MSDALHRLLVDVGRDWGKDDVRRVHWEAVDRKLFASIEADQRAERDGLLAPRWNRAWTAGIAGLAAAFALAVFVGKTREQHPLDLEHLGVVDEAGNVVAIDGDGEALVDGRPTSVGATVRIGDVIDARGAQVTLGRPGKLTLVVERGSSATVTHVQGALVVALARGAVEAQVLPVASGEALAVDVGPSRVAIHGTHLRVARMGQLVVMDLNEGVVSLGEAPRVGSTLGAVVAAPAHAEFIAADAQGTLRVTHDPAEVRPPVAVSATPQFKSGSGATVPPPAPPRTESHDATPPGTSRAEQRSTTIGSGVSWMPPPADPNAQTVVSTAVRTCLAERLHADDIAVVVSTTLYLQLRDDGSVRSARFDPPVAPEVNTCAAQSIFKARFTHDGAVTIPISVKN